jgi:hypothetical protein
MEWFRIGTSSTGVRINTQILGKLFYLTHARCTYNLFLLVMQKPLEDVFNSRNWWITAVRVKMSMFNSKLYRSAWTCSTGVHVIATQNWAYTIVYISYEISAPVHSTLQAYLPCFPDSLRCCRTHGANLPFALPISSYLALFYVIIHVGATSAVQSIRASNS